MVNKKKLQWAFWFALISAVVMFFEDVGEAMGILWIDEWDEIHVWEFLIVGFLVAAIVLLGREVRKMETENQSLEARVAAASSAFSDLMNAHYETWGLSSAEQDITALLLKGCTISEIAEIRGTSEGTVKAQTNKIYKKSGYENRSQLFSAIIEELTDGGSLSRELSGAEAAPPNGAPVRT